MKSMKNIIIILIILLLILAITVIVIVNERSKTQKLEDENEDESNVIIDYQKEKVTNATLFYTVEACIQQYIDAIYTSEAEILVEMLSEKYINENNINNNNVLNYVDKVKTVSLFDAKKMNTLPGERIETYAVYGIISNRDNPENRQEAYYLVLIDNYNSTFSITPMVNKNIGNVNDIDLESEVQLIDTVDNNAFEYYRITDETLIRNYLGNYKSNVLYNIQDAYELLDEEYRNKRFGSLDSYKMHVTEELSKIKGSLVAKYKINQYNDYVQYVCIDRDENYYIINETAVMEYSLILDTYTLDLPEFLEKYNSTNPQGMVALNIQKFIDSINNKDYKYAYSKLAEGFKNSNFSTLQSFERYIKSNIYEKNKIEYLDFKEEGSVYTYKIIFSDANSENTPTKTKTIIMQLQEGTGFVLSFDV